MKHRPDNRIDSILGRLAFVISLLDLLLNLQTVSTSEHIPEPEPPPARIVQVR